MESKLVEALPALDHTSEDLGTLLSLLGSEHPFVRHEASVALAQMADRAQRNGLLANIGPNRMRVTLSELLHQVMVTLAESSALRRAAIADSLGQWRYVEAVPPLIQLLSDEESGVRASAATSLGKLGDPSAVHSLCIALADGSLWVRSAAAAALGMLADSSSAGFLAQAIQDEAQPLVRASIVSALGHIDTTTSRNALNQVLQDQDSAMRWYAARALVNVGGISSLPELRQLLHDEERVFDRTVGQLAQEAIAAIEKRDRGPIKSLLKAFYGFRHWLLEIRKP